MKKLTLFFVFLSTLCFSQTTKPVKTFPVVEKAVFDTINKYRVKNGLKKVVWCDKAYQAAYHHSYYLSDFDSIPMSHYETVNVNNFEELYMFDDRLRKYIGCSPYGVENILSSNFSDWWFNKKKSDPIKLYSKCILDDWKNSKPHNESLLDKRVTHGAIAVVRELDGTWCRVVLVFYENKKGM